MIEFIRDKKDSKWKVIEINIRPWLFIGFYELFGLKYLSLLYQDWQNLLDNFDGTTIFPSKEVLFNSPIHVDIGGIINFGENIISAWDKDKQPDQWKRLNEIIEERNPQKIGLNYSKYFNIADGLDKTDHDEFMANISEKNREKVVSAQKLATAWIETRTNEEMEIYRQIVTITKEIINQAFSLDVIQIGKTSTSDLEWWMRQKVTDMGLNTWFHPTVDIQRKSEANGENLRSFSNRPSENIIQKGDLLHCDFGITYLRLNSDCQQMAYVLNDNEDNIPVYLSEAFNKANLLQDILTSNFIEGNSGNQILLNSLSEAKKIGLRPSIYTHPLGSYAVSYTHLPLPTNREV